VLGDGGHHTRKHGRALADYIAGKIVVAPDGPQTDHYWSNRVYQVLGFGGFLLHPRCVGLREQYDPYSLMTYRNWDHLDEMLDDYQQLPHSCKLAAEMGHAVTLRHHLYRHRCEQLIAEVQRHL